MAVTLANTFEGGSNGTTITQGSGGNSGGSSGSFFDVVTIGTGASVTFTNSAIRGSFSMAAATTGTSSSASGTWSTSIGTAVASPFHRVVFKVSSLSVTAPIWRQRGAAVQSYRITINTSGKIELRNSANTIVATSTTTVSTNTAYLLRIFAPVGASVNPTVAIHTDPTSATASETLAPTAVNGGTNNIDETSVGIVVSTANVNTVTIDDWVFTDVALPGPASQSVTISDSGSFAESLTRGLLLPRSFTESPTIADSVSRTLIVPRGPTDSTTVSDSLSRTVNESRTPSDSATVADSLDRAITESRATSDAVTAADSPASNTNATRSVADSIGTAEALTPALAAPRSTADSASLGEAVTTTTALNAAGTDGFSLAEAAASLLAAARPVVDSVTLADVASAIEAGFTPAPYARRTSARIRTAHTNATVGAGRVTARIRDRNP